MSLKPREHDRKFGELDQVVRAYTGRNADDDEPLTAYLRHTWRTRPWAIAIAEQQLREYAGNPPGRLRLRLGEFYPVPDVGLPDDEIQGWLIRLADRLKESVETGQAPPPAPPRTRWEWHARFPELAQLLGGWFSQDMPDEFEDHDEALQDYLDTTDSGLIAQLTGEVHDALTLPLEESDYALALDELGMEVDPPEPFTPSGWLADLAVQLRQR
ncbi:MULTISPECIES: contact-dependent growth inhibition system immunity protein [unclassified Streptomyces]|uniref:contact-dependent growth inhibition system immunity protein n=1 Tax=unclassified Streptomyces TaxID=2593676 RepID=UPI0028C38ED2|nr:MULTISPECIES: contact-dependent growth inhibition system immunity protein [unclassified Streptomyces]WNO72856.1 contact-dependent growth inhibition system immunity protein [Streptomyces sp. AM8-1-1]